MDAQSRLLHVLQDNTVLPIGSNQTVQVDTQIIAATHKDLDQLVQIGQFRQDLYYRLNGLIIELPRFAKRDDKRAFIEHIHRGYSQDHQGICPHLMALLMHYTWPGNLRELDSLLKVATLMAHEPSLSLAHVPAHLAQKLGQLSEPNAAATEVKDLRSTVDESLVKTYQATQGNISQTSRLLGISRNTIYRKLKSLGMVKSAR